ncbi:MAG TPA: hypothetical protein VFD39_08820, partial [Trueperaceae bacterium]|nr:hypothetical protein [Trueperaceae bacterium]
LALMPGASDPELSEAEVAVAKRLAAAYLDASLDELLPRAVSEPALKRQLVLVARCRAALTTGKSVEQLGDDDLLVLDERIVRFLGGSWADG